MKSKNKLRRTVLQRHNELHVRQGQLLWELYGLPVAKPHCGLRPRVSKAGLARLTGLTVGQLDYRMAAYKAYVTQDTNERDRRLERRRALLRRYSTQAQLVRFGSASLEVRAAAINQEAALDG